MSRRYVVAVLALLVSCSSEGHTPAAGGGSNAAAGASAMAGMMGPSSSAGFGGTDESFGAGGSGISSGGAVAGESNIGGMTGGGPSSTGRGGTAGDSGELGIPAGKAGAGGGRAGGGGDATGNAGTGNDNGLPARAAVLDVLRRANAYFVAKWPDPGKAIDSSHPSHIWTRAVYYEGLLGLYGVDPQASDLSYALAWATSHAWGIYGGTTTRSADNQCAGQTYLDLYLIDPQPSRIADIETNVDMVVAGATVNDWTWIDAIQMAMPVFAKLGALSGRVAYYDKMYAMYSSAKNSQGTAGFYSNTDHLWWRDANYDPPYTEPNGKSCYWSRGNGWVFAALARVLETIPESEAHRAEYLADFSAMAEALRSVQRPDGFWNVSLHDPTHFGGPELTGTSLFTYGMAWGVRKGVLSAASFQPVINHAWSAMASAVHANGFLGYVQGTGQQPSDGQPVTFDKQPNYEDFGLGCFLLGGSEVARLAAR
jgi:unsaturated rhamnogalacturonyl hydrolase